MTFSCTKTFWTKSTKIILNSGVPEANLGILITHFPEVLLLWILWYIWSLSLLGWLSSFSGHSHLVNQLLRFLSVIHEDAILHFVFQCCIDLWRSNFTVSYAEDSPVQRQITLTLNQCLLFVGFLVLLLVTSIVSRWSYFLQINFYINYILVLLIEPYQLISLC